MRWFVSYCFDDEKEYCDRLQDWAKDNRLSENIVIFIEQEDKRIEGESAIKDYLKTQLKKSNGLLVLVGDNCHNRPWMDYEAAVAASIQLPIITIRVPGTTGAAPKLLGDRTLIAYEPNAIKNEIIKSKK